MTVTLEVALIGTLFLVVLLFAVATCLVVRGKPSSLQLLALNIPWAMGFLSLGLRNLLRLHGFHDHLSLQALGLFYLTVAAMNIACMWWIGSQVRARVRARWAGIVLGILLSVVCLALSPLLLHAQATALSDLLIGPRVKHGITQDLDRWPLRRSIPDGILVVDGASYRVPDLDWFGDLAVGQPVEFLYGPHTGMAFAPSQAGLSPLALLLIAASLGCEALSIVLAATEPATDSTRPSPKSTRSLLQRIEQQRQADREDAERARKERKP